MGDSRFAIIAAGRYVAPNQASIVANLATTTVASIQTSGEWGKERGMGCRQYIGMVTPG